MSRVVGLVPAAGRAVRLQPLVGSKEMVEVGGVPVVAHLLARLRAAGCDELRLVTRPDKADLRAWAHELRVVLGEPTDVSQSLLLGAAGLAPDDVVLLGFPDTVWGPEDGFARLLAVLVPGVDVVLGLFSLPDVRAADEVRLDDDGRVLRVRPKPDDPVSSLTWGCAAVRVAALAGLADDAEPGRLFDRLAREAPGSVVGVDLGSDFVDVGTPAGLARARAEAAARLA